VVVSYFTRQDKFVITLILYDNKRMYYVYILENTVTKKWYIGYTSNLRQRVSDHNNRRGGKTTKQGLP